MLMHRIQHTSLISPQTSYSSWLMIWAGKIHLFPLRGIQPTITAYSIPLIWNAWLSVVSYLKRLMLHPLVRLAVVVC